MRVVSTVPDLLARLEDSGLIADDPMLTLRRWADDRRAGLGQLAQEVLGRNLLTRYQLREVAAGRAARLTLGPYRLLDLLGEGGMGQVFHARHTRLDREVAVKLIRPEKVARPSVVERFRQEIRAAARLSHPNVVLAFNADEADGLHYYSMEYVPGADLGRVVADRGPLPVADAVGYIRQAADGLQHAADLGLVHRDVKPANLLLTPDGRVKVLDLGLALLSADAEPDPDAGGRAGVIVGSPDFMAPEQVRSPLTVDGRADVYALGGTLFYLLTGKPPVAGETVEEKVRRHLAGPPPSVRECRPEVSPDLDAVVRWMLAKNPSDRPATPAVAAAALAPLAPGGSGRTVLPVPAPAALPPDPLSAFELVADSPAAPVNLPAQRRRGGTPGKPVAAVLATLLLLAAGGFAHWLSSTGGKRAELPAAFTNTVGMKLVKLDGGEVAVGSPAGEPGRGIDEPQSTVTVSGPFFVGATEVTHGQYLLVMGKSPAKWPARMRDAKAVPADSVTLNEAVEFCRRLTEKEGRRDGWAYRLPTEAEWEYAARGGTATPFWAGDRLTFGDSGVFSPDADNPAPRNAETGMPHPVGGGRATPFGLFDVCGNVWEWTDSGVLRGGSWREPASRCRSASRKPFDGRAEDVGFRVVFAVVRKDALPGS